MIVVPMAGLSARFTAAGYDRPKYMLPLKGRPLFVHAVESFAAYLASEPFLFIYREVQGTGEFVQARAAAMGIRAATFVALDAPTEGQADTVAIGLDRGGVAADAPITIFNIDTFRPGFRYPAIASDPQAAGYLEVFEGEGANWSFVRPDPADPRWVAETAEKKAISNLCCTGLYQFRRAGDFRDALAAGRTDDTLRGPKAELYVAPLYNWLIRRGAKIGYDVIPAQDVIFCGVPAEYEALRAQAD
jgi:hypothetical protein